MSLSNEEMSSIGPIPLCKFESVCGCRKRRQENIESGRVGAHHAGFPPEYAP
jgi:hypothetical protein